jgi:hypothetical protein
MMTWNSPLSVGFDILFGFLPSILLLILCVLGIFYGSAELISSLNPPSVIRPFDPTVDQDDESFTLSPEESRRILILSLGGIFASASMIFVTFRRQNAQPKPLLILSLCTGLSIVVFQFYSMWSTANSTFDSAFVHPAIYLGISIVAIKHIIMLTRA